MAKAAFERLEVYRVSERLADGVWNVVLRWSIFAQDTVGKQLIRAADSVGANIAEGYGRGDAKDHRRFLRVARGSLNETSHWLRRAFVRKLLTKEEIQTLRPLLDELGPRLNAYMKSIQDAPGLKRPTTNNLRPTTGNTGHRA